MDVFIAFAKTISDVPASESRKENFQKENDRNFWNMMNEIVNSFSKYIHCELIFMIRNEQTKKIRRIVSSIHQSKFLRLVQKRYRGINQKKWKFFKLNLNDQQKQQVFDHEMAQNEKKFNNLGFYLNFILPGPLNLDYKGEQVFCSEEIVRCLERTYPLMSNELKPYSTHPEQLMNYLTTKNMVGKECVEPTPKNFQQI